MNKLSKAGRTWALIFAIAILAAGAFWFFALRTIASTKIYRQPSASMLPTLELNDLVRVDTSAYKTAPPQFGDLIVVAQPERALMPDQKDVKFIKRYIGGPGDLIEIRKGKLFRNGKETPEPYIRNPMPEEMSFRLIEMKGNIIPLLITSSGANSPMNGTVEEYCFTTAEHEAEAMKQKAVPIPPGKILVMGDNRDNSSDSRMWGLADLDKVVGKATKL